ncbi:pyridoxamine 5'-phosphate oxidase family protein [Aquipuribacter hungaricus]|uniref:Pyridoxamine 5'-phosphate oxidase family protein n=1 Tax=Aquipuribacter hungaricus TaxID=545624 RepID=A0ABV7WDS0_9MICO
MDSPRPRPAPRPRPPSTAEHARPTGHAGPTEHAGTASLPEHESWALLRAAPVGRLAVVVDGAPDVFPVNHLVDHGTLVVRTAGGSKLAGALGQPVAFEVDGYDDASGEAWSVVVHGLASEVAQLHDAIDAFLLPSVSWHAGPKPHLLRVVPTRVTGHRFRRVATVGA